MRPAAEAGAFHLRSGPRTRLRNIVEHSGLAFGPAPCPFWTPRAAPDCPGLPPRPQLDVTDPTDHPVIERARATLRTYRIGSLESDGNVHRRRFIIDPTDGALILELTNDELEARETVLHVPEEELPGAADTSLQLLLVLHPLDPERDFVCDRFVAAHGRRSLGRFARGRIETARTADAVIEGDDLMVPSDIRAAEPALLRALNADRAALRRVVRDLAGVDIDEPVAVACDRFGFDARGGVGVVRVEFASPAKDADEAARIIDNLLGAPSA